ncbi:hypothetical protein G3580_02600 [Nitrogeniibacter mangrovi]|uniref:Uncharacterized protein n=2 Tax=Nitrogeniibacter mangrovi TaxID=2016596 RepID=A0A6C1B9Z9_9RHOO|nr:hypothetical protein G3580_02600 [Nitrogeniibacter mangrovi]
MGLSGLTCLLFGLALLLGIGTGLHPLLGSSGAGLAIVVSGVALVGSAGFPLVIARLTAQEEAGADEAQ